MTALLRLAGGEACSTLSLVHRAFAASAIRFRAAALNFLWGLAGALGAFAALAFAHRALAARPAAESFRFSTGAADGGVGPVPPLDAAQRCRGDSGRFPGICREDTRQRRTSLGRGNSAMS